MKLVLKGHDERYVVEQGMLNLFPGERPVYEPIGPEDDTWARVSLREEADGCTVEVELSWRGTAASHRLDAPLTGDEFQPSAGAFSWLPMRSLVLRPPGGCSPVCAR